MVETGSGVNLFVGFKEGCCFDGVGEDKVG